ncbi:hypothetical protein AIOL_002542 [Candidatus Rhodobacter oscarellae]|uniref:VOC domain-containing protein n=1 Tax=Candidatus Rhodobacter oscarellae TaxID=1675527 RepID=A0A0J9E4C0_9RHOB|nr:VOC family protein [Candidatus Rhodobacter lobularis]KMW57577.1 hypothetical protein AIOL_002542 [Candidatus Rhodobacter lobularis]
MPGLSHIVLYVKDLGAVQAFYCHVFGYRARNRPGDRITELIPDGPGARLLLHKASAKARQGQAQTKLSFQVADVAIFCAEADTTLVQFGAIHDAGDYEFANAKDPAGNSVQVTSRPFET